MTEDGPRSPDPRMIPRWEAPSPSPPSGPEPTDSDAPDDWVLVRPFLVTGGRTRPLQDNLRVETMVSALPAALSAPLRFELRRIVELCQYPVAVAEVAVRLGLPLGVARVLISDLAYDGYVVCTEPSELSIDIIERIMERVRAL